MDVVSSGSDLEPGVGPPVEHPRRAAVAHRHEAHLLQAPQRLPQRVPRDAELLRQPPLTRQRLARPQLAGEDGVTQPREDGVRDRRPHDGLEAERLDRHLLRLAIGSKCDTSHWSIQWTSDYRAGHVVADRELDRERPPVRRAGVPVDARARAAHVPVPQRRLGAGVRRQGHRDQPQHGTGVPRGGGGLEARHGGRVRRGLRAHAAAAVAGQPVDVGAPVLRRRLPLLLLPPLAPRGPGAVGVARRPPLQRALQLLHRAAPALDAVHRAAVLAAAGPDRDAAVDDPAAALDQPRLPVLPAHRAHRQAAALVRVGVQHPVPPPRAPRHPGAVPRPQLRRHPHPVGPAVPHVRAGARARRSTA